MSYNTPKYATAFKFYVGLVDQANTKLLKVNPTIAAGDFKVSIDGGAFNNLTTLPSVNPAGGRAVMIDLSAAEMTGSNIVVQAVDAAGAEWCDQLINLQPATQTVEDLPAFSSIVEGSYTFVQALRLLNSALGSKVSGMAGTNPVFRDISDTKNRINATVDSNGNRSAITLDLT